MNKKTVVPLILILWVLVFGITLVLSINAKGGLSPTTSEEMGDIPLVERVLKVQPKLGPDSEGEEKVEVSSQMSFLMHADQRAVQRLARELEVKKADYELAMEKLQRRTRELEAWDGQIKRERDKLLEEFKRRKTELDSREQQVQQQEAALQERALLVSRREEENLKKMADIYGKMDAPRAAAVLSQMFNKEEKEESRTAVKIIYLMPERSAAKVLASITDPTVGAEITEQLSRIAQESKEED